MKSVARSVAGTIWVLLTPALNAAVIFNIGSGSVVPGGNVSIPITISSDLTGNYVYWGNAGFELSWDPTVITLQPTPVSLTGTPLPIGTGNFASSSGLLTFTWTSLDPAGTGTAVPSGSTLVTVQFSAPLGADGSTGLSFSKLTKIGLVDSAGNGSESVTPTFTAGTVNVVPEPVNCALAVFSSVWVGFGTLTLLRKRSMGPRQFPWMQR